MPPDPQEPPQGRPAGRRGLSRAVAAARRDLAYRPRLRPYGTSPRAARGTMAAVAVGVAASLVIGLLAWKQMAVTDGPAESTSVTRRPAERQGGFVAGSAPVRPAVEPVAPLKALRTPHLFVVTKKSVTRATAERVARAKGVRAVEAADAASVRIDGKQVQTLGVSPSTFRAFTPERTAKSNELWANIAAGDVAVSFVLGNDGGLPLGTVASSGGRSLRVGAYATTGMGAIDAVVSRQTARMLGIPENNALIVSAPSVDSTRLRRTLLRVLPKGTQIALVNPVSVRAAGTGRTTALPPTAFASDNQIRTALTAAASKLGRPYVWGAEGPDSFDCSGLVQWAFAQAGIRVPRVTHQQFVAGAQIPLEQARPGDLIFWRHDPTNPGYVSHVAIYWGDGKMLHAPRTGDVVKMAPVTTRNLAGVVRISPNVAARVR
ncbi:Cell wall-associated hydrolase, NlpC family [Sinosporangium album]|uniref:Cell wall-associated hydrolase, NlpC family n=2 Tax=Sinosporangium album TaxID=504805 RepID=A0A1G7XXC0_9ACTN|nr:Cell wall-associated hydrolase, NlpC family [Sinosporangium album]